MLMDKSSVFPDRHIGSVLLVALLLPGAALILQLLLWPVVQPFLWFFFYPAVFFSAHFGGLRGGLPATLLSVGLANYFFVDPIHSLAVSAWPQVAVMAMFAIMGGLISLVHQNHHLARARLRLALSKLADSEHHYRAMFETAEGQAFSFPPTAPATPLSTGDVLPQYIPEREFRLLAESVPQIVWITNPEGENIFFNQKWVDYTGMSLEESHGHGWNIPFHPDDRQRAWDAWQNAIHHNGTYSLECRLRRADGSYRWWLVRGVPAFDREGKIYKWFGTCTDIHDIKAAQETLRHNEKRLRFALDSLQAGEWQLELDQLTAVCSLRHDQIFGYEKPHPGWSYAAFMEHVVAEDRERVDASFQQALSAQALWDFECRIRRTDGDIRWIQGCGQPRVDSSGRRLLVGVVIDISERKRADIRLQDSEKRFRLLFEHLPIPYQSLDIQGHWLDANQQMADLLGFASPADMLGGDFGDFWALECDGFHARFDEFKRTHNVEGELQLVRRDGRKISVLIAGRIQRDLDGRFERTHCILVDITERHDFETRISELNIALDEKLSQLKAANAAKTQFLAHMSHELRTPLNSIMGFAQILEMDRISPEQREMLQAINQASADLLHMINDLLDLTTIEAGGLVLQTESFQLETLLGQLESLLRNQAASKGLSLQVRCLGAEPGRLSGDPLRLKQVLLNLLGNAIKFTGRGEVSLTVQRLSTDGAAIWLRFEVRDTGIGISREVMDRLFQPFSQGDPSITRRFGGTGLGLVISQRIVEAMGGRMGVSSEVDRGSLFWFEAPFARAGRGTVATDAASAPLDRHSLAGLRVLSVDDNLANLRMIEQVLVYLGAAVTAVQSGRAALDRLRAAPGDFDAVLLDVQMPELDGLSVAREIRRDERLSGLPIIALTAGVTAEECQAALGAGMNNFLGKPVDLRQMHRVLAAYLKPG
ncbi:hypothetical protein JCM19379_08380 [Methyloparacoccus murrellii]